MCPILLEVQRLWSMSQNSSSSEKPTTISHVEGNLSTNASHAKSIKIVEKPKQMGCKHMLPCKINNGDHLTHPCPTIPKV